MRRILIYLHSECIEKDQFELCPKYDRVHAFDVIFGTVIPCRKLRWICRKDSNNTVRQVETSEKTKLYRATCRVEVTLCHDCKTHGYCNRRIFSLATCELLARDVLCFATFVRYIIIQLFHEFLCHINISNYMASNAITD